MSTACRLGRHGGEDTPLPISEGGEDELECVRRKRKARRLAMPDCLFLDNVGEKRTLSVFVFIARLTLLVVGLLVSLPFGP